MSALRYGNSLLSVYRRLTPTAIKNLAPYSWRQAILKTLFGETYAYLGVVSPEGLKVLHAATSATRAENWQEASALWTEASSFVQHNEVLFGKVKYNASVTTRLAHPQIPQEAIEQYWAMRSRQNNQPRIALYTAIVNGYDSLKLPEELDPNIDYIVFSTEPQLAASIWQVRPVTYFADQPTRTARFVKTHPHLLLDGYDYAVWLDANIMPLRGLHDIIESFKQSNRPVAAIPHPHRHTVQEEHEACTHYRKDDVDALDAQMEHVKSRDFETDNLLESGFLIFDLQHPRLADFFTSWWNQIDAFSKRDQLSLPLALHDAKLDVHLLTERPQSVRNMPEFAFLPHGESQELSRNLLKTLSEDSTDPYAAPPYATVRADRIALHQNKTIDVVVCVHNALSDVRACLQSLLTHRKSAKQRLILVDDGSERDTADYLKGFATEHSTWCTLISNETPVRYTKAANQGLRASTANFVILLNSDTIVTDGWAEKLADAAFSCKRCGLVGPLSNAASQQSIPSHKGSAGQTAINELPPHVSIAELAELCERHTQLDILPRVPLVHGFCFGITREVLEAIGYLDEHSFPNGFGEENDYCFRAAQAGFELVVATHTYVYHAKSKSYGTSGRKAIADTSYETLTRMYSLARIKRATTSLDNNPLLQKVRDAAQALYTQSKRSCS